MRPRTLERFHATSEGYDTRMDLTRVRYFHAVATFGGVRQASEQLHVSAPAISRAIRQLEREVGRTLIQPAGRGLELTEDGRITARWAGRVLDEVGSLKRAFERTDQAQLAIGTFEFFMTHAFSALLDVLPSTLVVRDLPPDTLEDALIQRRIDIGITVRPYPKPGVDHVEAGRFHMGVYALAGRFAGMGPTDTPFAVPLDMVSDSPVFQRAQDGWPDETHLRNATHRVDLLETGLELCRQGRTAAFLPDFIVHQHNRTVAPHLRLTPVAWPLPAEVVDSYPAFVVRRSSESSTPAHELAERVATRLGALFTSVDPALRHSRD